MCAPPHCCRPLAAQPIPLHLSVRCLLISSQCFKGLLLPPPPPRAAQMLQNPAVRSMMSAVMQQPGFMDTMINANPSLRQMVDANPAMRAMLADPNLMQQIMNPETLQVRACALAVASTGWCTCTCARVCQWMAGWGWGAHARAIVQECGHQCGRDPHPSVFRGLAEDRGTMDDSCGQGFRGLAEDRGTMDDSCGQKAVRPSMQTPMRVHTRACTHTHTHAYRPAPFDALPGQVLWGSGCSLIAIRTQVKPLMCLSETPMLRTSYSHMHNPC